MVEPLHELLFSLVFCPGQIITMLALFKPSVLQVLASRALDIDTLAMPLPFKAPLFATRGRRPYEVFDGWGYIRKGEALSTLLGSGFQLAILVSAMLSYGQSASSLGILPTLVTLSSGILLSAITVVSELVRTSLPLRVRPGHSMNMNTGVLVLHGQFDSSHKVTVPPAWSKKTYMYMTWLGSTISMTFHLVAVYSLQWLVGSSIQCSLSQCCSTVDMGACYSCKYR